MKDQTEKLSAAELTVWTAIERTLGWETESHFTDEEKARLLNLVGQVIGIRLALADQAINRCEFTG